MGSLRVELLVKMDVRDFDGLVWVGLHHSWHDPPSLRSPGGSRWKGTEDDRGTSGSPYSRSELTRCTSLCSVHPVWGPDPRLFGTPHPQDPRAPPPGTPDPCTDLGPLEDRHVLHRGRRTEPARARQRLSARNPKVREGEVVTRQSGTQHTNIAYTHSHTAHTYTTH